MRILACDPGINGGFSIIQESEGFQNELIVYPSPIDKDGEVDSYSINQWIVNQCSEINYDAVWIEDVHSIGGSGAKMNFNFGRNLGLLQAVFKMAKISYRKVQPKIWQAQVHQGNYTKDIHPKIKTRDAITRLYPHIIPLITPVKTKRMKNDPVPHDGILDSIGIGYYGKLVYEGKIKHNE
jgi:hypothetical protein